MELNYLTVGKNKGEWDFGVSGALNRLSDEEMNKLRAMTVVAIGTMEDMWRREVERRNPASEVAPTT